MDTLDLLLALGPISIYLLLIGRVNLARRPFLTTGMRDLLTLAIAVGGLAVVGPLRLFMPTSLAGYLGVWIWAPLISLYGLCALLAVLLTRPRLIVYNVTLEQLRPVLESLASQLDADHRWAGASLVLPNLGVQYVLESAPAMRNVQLIAAGDAGQDLNGWRRLELELRVALRDVRVEPNPRGWSFLVFGVLLAAMLLYSVNERPAELARGIQDFLGD